VIQIEALPQRAGVEIAEVLKRVAVGVAEAAGVPAKRVFVTWRELAAERYTEGDRAVSLQPFDTHPPVVTLVAFEGRPDEMVERMIHACVGAITSGLEIDPGNVFLTYHEGRSGRIFSGGRIMRRT
jgi:hypothetical protein